METMKAVRLNAIGGPEQLALEDVPRPEPGPGEVLIKVSAAGVNPVDWIVRQGLMPFPLPLTPGCDVAGVVEALGPGSSRLAVGDEVYAFLPLGQFGGYAEYAVTRETEVARKPSRMDFIQAASVPVAAMTAWQCLFEAAHLSSGQSVLIHAASGGVGSFAVQLARYQGARVYATASARNEDFVKDLGADHFIDYNTTRFEEVARDMDVVLDTLGGEAQQRSWQVLKAGGVLVSVKEPPSADLAAAAGVEGKFVAVHANGGQLDEIGQLIDEGKMRTEIQTILPLSQAGEAHKLSETGHTRGKIVLTTGA